MTATPINMNKHPKVLLEFTAKTDNIGILALHPLYFYIADAPKQVEDWQKLRIRMKEKDAKDWYASAEYSAVERGDSKVLPFGFAVIADSQGKIYVVEMELLNPKSNNSIEIRTTPFTASVISQMDKKALILNYLQQSRQATDIPRKFLADNTIRLLYSTLHRGERCLDFLSPY